MITAPKHQGENFHHNLRLVDEMKKLALREGCTTSQLALAWVAAQGMIAIPGTTKPLRLEENWAARHVDLTEDERWELRRIIHANKPRGNRYPPRMQARVGH
jgi:aryl-alcohol dehydrogenase-like predicted oxidoreductase